MENGTVTPVKVSLGKDDLIVGVALAGNAELYLATKNALWRWKPGTAKAKWIEAAPDKTALTDVACHVQTGSVLLSTRQNNAPDYYYKNDTGFCFKRSRGTPMTFVGIRYPPGSTLECPVFLPDGSFLFSADGDLWHGLIVRSTEAGDPAGNWTRGNLVAYRYAPMAQRQTDDVTPPETGISDIAVSRNKAYVNFKRMFGSGWGSVQRLNLPVQKQGEWQFKNSAKDTVRALGSLEEEEELTKGGWVYLCGSSDGRQIYCGDGYGSNRTDNVIEDDGLLLPVPHAPRGLAPAGLQPNSAASKTTEH